MPHGNFDSPMTISSSGDSVEACGPLIWDGATTITIEHVEIKQGSADAEKNPNLQNQAPQEEWMVQDVPCTGPGRFHDGSAKAEATVRVVLQNGTTTTEHWEEDVQLSH